MQSKISCFNKTIFMKNLTRFWPFALLYGMYLVFAHPLILYVMLSVEKSSMNTDYWEVVAGHFAGMSEPISVFLFAIIMATAVFGYLYQSRSTNMLHTFPVTRGELFATNYVSALVLMVVPQFLCALATNFVIIGKANGLIWAVWAWFGMMVGETVFFLGLAVLAAMFTGQMLTAAVFYMAVNVLYEAVILIIDAVAELFVYGLRGNVIQPGSHVFFPLARFMRYVGFSISRAEEVTHFQADGIGTLLAYAFAGLVLAGAAYYAYRRRALECAGDFLSFKWTRPVFRWAVAILAGSAFSLVVTAIVCDGRGTQRHASLLFIVWLLIFAAVFFFVAQMFVEKSFRVFKRRIAVECVSCLAVLLVGVALLQFDVFGIESYVPEVSDVAMAELSGDGAACFDSETDIEKLTALHEMIVERIGEQKGKQGGGFSEEGSFFYIGVSYELKNGESVERSYPLVIDDKEYLDRLWTSFSELIYDTEATKRSYFGMNYDEADWRVVSAMLDYYSGEDNVNRAIYGTEEEMQRLYEAALLDIEAGAFSSEGMKEEISGALEDADGEAAEVTTADTVAMNATLMLNLVSDRADVRGASTSNISISHVTDQSQRPYTDAETYLYLNADCTHLIELLTEMGVIGGVEELSVSSHW